MLRLQTTLLLLFGALGTLSASYFHVLERTPESVTVEWTAPDAEWQHVETAGGRFAVPRMGGLPLRREYGRPQLPFDAYTPPFESKQVQVVILDSLYETRPCPPLIFFPEDSPPYPNEVAEAGWFPRSFFEIERADQRGKSFYRLQINPLKYDASSGSVQLLRYAKALFRLQPDARFLQRTAAAPLSKASGVKLFTMGEGVIQVSGADLMQTGVDLASWDPRNLRLENRGRSLPFMMLGGEDGRFDPEDRLFFHVQRLSGDGEFHHASTDTNVYWLQADGGGHRFSPSASIAGEASIVDFKETLHFEKDLEYYNGDSSNDIQESLTVPDEGWVWDSMIDPGDVFRASFDLPAISSGADSARLRFRVRGQTLDAFPNSHHIRVRLNRQVVYDGFFDDRQELIGRAVFSNSLLKESDNLLEVESLRDNPSAASRFYFDWFEIDYRRRMLANNGFLRVQGVAPQYLYWAQGFSSPAVHIWDVKNRLEITPLAVGREWPAELRVESAGLEDGNFARFFLNGQQVFSGNRGINVVALDGRSGIIAAARSFDTYGQASASDSLAAFLRSLPDSSVVLAAVMDDGSVNLRPAAVTELQVLGSRQIGQLGYRDSWVFIGRRGSSTAFTEQLSARGSGPARAAATVVFSAGTSYQVRFSASAYSDTLVIFEESAATPPLRIKWVPESRLERFTGADYLIVTHRRFAEQADRLARHRESRDRFSVFIADIEEIYDAFNHGIPDAEALRSFLRFAYEKGNPRPSFILLFGDASWDPKKNLPNAIFENYVPTMGNPVSDVLLACFDGPDDMLPEISIGRIPVANEAQAAAFVDKIIEYDGAPSAEWQKNFLFISGGLDASEQRQFKAQSDALARDFVAAAPTFGRPLFISKTDSGDAVDFRSRIIDAFAKGALWVNFIGHAASRTWELMFNTPDIDDLNNKGRYPFISSMTCHTGRFAEPTQESFSEHFLLARDKGAIGFWGTSGWGYSFEDYLYLREILPTVTVDSLRFLGDIVRVAKERLWRRYGSGAHIRNLSLQYNLLSDPALRLTLPLQPDLAVRPDGLLLTPSMPSESDSTAMLRVTIENWGLGCSDSSTVAVLFRHQGSGKALEMKRRIGPVGLETFVDFELPLRGLAGLVEADVTVDADDRIREADENNNSCSLRITVLSSDLQLIAPPPNAVVPLAESALKVQAPQTQYDDSILYYFELDTCRTFDSPAFRSSPPIRAHPLLVRWAPTDLQPNRRYFWRVRSSDMPVGNDTLNAFFTSSGSEFGWRQIDDVPPPRLAENIRSNNGFELARRSMPILVQSFRTQNIGYALIEVDRRLALTTGRGHNLAVLDPVTGRIKATGSFDTYGNPQAPQQLATFLKNVREGDIVLAAVSDEGGLNLNEEIYSGYESVGSALCRRLEFRYAWALMGRKGGAVGSAVEGLQPPGGSAVIIKDSLQVLCSSGRLVSKVGPASAWHNAEIEVEIPDSTSLNLRVSGCTLDGEERLLFSPAETRIDLSSVDARQYPYLLLGADLATSGGRTSPKLRRWEVSYTPVPDLALSPHLFTQTADTVMVGGVVTFFFDLYNVGLKNADSVVVRIESKNGDRANVHSDLSVAQLEIDKYRPLQFRWTADRPGEHRFIFTADPDLKLVELNESNNTVLTRVQVQPDALPPQIRLTFDGRDIFDGDWVAVQPLIEAAVSDNNPEPFDTTRISLFLDGRRVPFKSSELSLQSGSGTGLLRYTPELSAGEHQLEIVVSDAARNQSTAKARFRVEDGLMFRNLLNYPNPFSDATEFCFEISQAADVTIKVYTVAGRLIRTLSGGRMMVGYNRIFWDGRDEDGDPLADGVYLYKVSAAYDGRRAEAVNKAVVVR